MSVTLQAAVHLGQDCSQNLRSTKNQPLKSVKQLFRTTEKLIKDQMEIKGLSTLDWNQAIQMMMAELRCEPKQFKGRFIFMSMYNDMKW